MSTSTASAPTATTVARRARRNRLLLLAGLGLVALSITRVISGEGVLTASGTINAMVWLTLPVALAGLGGLISERAGVVNIGLEGMMILGTWGAGWAGTTWGPWYGLLAGTVLGWVITAIAAGANGWSLAVPPLVLIAGVLVTIAVGAIAGVLPAVRAARTSPTAALSG